MVQRLAILSGLVLSATCMVLHQPSIPLLFTIQPQDDSHYNFAYEVNDLHTGDIKSQRESRRGDTVTGQYQLLQPDGVRRTVDYRADDHTGFQATVNNDRPGVHPMRQQGPPKAHEQMPQNNVRNAMPHRHGPSWDQHMPNVQPTPSVAVSSNSIVHQSFAPTHPWD